MTTDAAEGAAPVYDATLSAKLESMWGAGYLSPGGDAEVDAIVDDVDLFGKVALDVGCGLGGPSCRLVEQHDVARVTAFDVEAPLLERARSVIEGRGMRGRIEVVLGAPGPLPFSDRAFDVVFSKDALVHVPDKAALYAEAFRVLRPGGWFCASDWYGPDGPLSPDMRRYAADGHLEFKLQTLAEARRGLSGAGFVDIASTDRNAWYAEQAKLEVARLEGPEREAVTALIGRDAADAWIERTRLRAVVAEQGQLRPGHFRARKPEA